MPTWILGAASIGTALVSGILGSYITMRVGLAVLATRLEACVTKMNECERRLTERMDAIEGGMEDFQGWRGEQIGSTSALEANMTRAEKDIDKISTQIRTDLRDMSTEVRRELASIAGNFDKRLEGLVNKVEGRRDLRQDGRDEEAGRDRRGSGQGR